MRMTRMTFRVEKRCIWWAGHGLLRGGPRQSHTFYSYILKMCISLVLNHIEMKFKQGVYHSNSFMWAELEAWLSPD